MNIPAAWGYIFRVNLSVTKFCTELKTAVTDIKSCHSGSQPAACGRSENSVRVHKLPETRIMQIHCSKNIFRNLRWWSEVKNGPLSCQPDFRHRVRRCLLWQKQDRALDTFLSTPFQDDGHVVVAVHGDERAATFPFTQICWEQL